MIVGLQPYTSAITISPLFLSLAHDHIFMIFSDLKLFYNPFEFDDYNMLGVSAMIDMHFQMIVIIEIDQVSSVPAL